MTSIDNILALIDAGLGSSTELDQCPDWRGLCWRCQERPAGESFDGACSPCASWLLGEGDDPLPAPREPRSPIDLAATWTRLGVGSGTSDEDTVWGEWTPVSPTTWTVVDDVPSTTRSIDWVMVAWWENYVRSRNDRPIRFTDMTNT